MRIRFVGMVASGVYYLADCGAFGHGLASNEDEEFVNCRRQEGTKVVEDGGKRRKT